MRRSLAFASILTATALSACSALAPFVGPRNACSTDVQCGAEASCVEARCVARQSSTWVVLAATPANSNQQRAFAPTTLAHQEVRAGSTRDITLARAREVRGVVRAPAGSADALVNANVRFVRSDAAANDPGVVRFSSASSDEATQGFSVFLAEGQYDVFVEPRPVAPTNPMGMEVQSLPPLVLRGALTVDFRMDPALPLPFGISYSDTLEVSGFIVDRDAGAGVGDLLVRIVDDKGAPLSTRGQTSTGSGAFRIGLAPQGSAQRWSLEISSAESAPTTGAAATSARAVYRIERDALLSNGELTGLQVRIPGLNRLARTTEGACVGCVPIEASVERAVRPLDETAGLSASVFMHGSLEDLPAGHHAWFEAYARSDARGAFTTFVLPGNYQVNITPEDESYALALSTLRVSTMVRGRTFTVPLKTSVNGVVRASLPNASPMSLVDIEAIPLNEPAPSGSAPALAPRAQTGRTDGAGAFSLRLDPGRYLIVARPSSATGFAAALTAQPVVVTTDGATPSVSLSVGAPIALRGRVLAPNQFDPVAAASVQAFARVPYTLSTGTSSSVDVSMFSAEADEDGEFEALLPAGLPAAN